METIKNYLETMFANLPNTLEVKRAKDELYSMMEDKYTELINEGKPQNEAVGIVISEFGNLDELAETLGIHEVINEVVVSDRRLVTQEEAERYIVDCSKQKFLVGLGVLLCIYSVIGPIVFNALGEMLHFESLVIIGVVLLFICVAAGVGLFIYSGFMMNDWSFLDKELCTIDYATAEFLEREKQEDRPLKGMLLTVGIMMFIVSIIPVILFEAIFGQKMILLSEGIGPAMIFVGTGIGVLLVIFSGARDAAYTKLLSLNDSTTVAGNYEPVKKTKKEYKNVVVSEIMGNYWRTVTCVYLIISFLTFKWTSTWIIWPIASILRRPITEILSRKDSDQQ